MKTISISKTHFTWLLAALALVFGALTLPTRQVQGAGSITVNSSNDPGDGTCDVSECTLREAIADSVAGGVINFDNDYTIVLESELKIDMDMTIDGDKNTIIVSGKDLVRVFYVFSGVTFNLNHITVTGGYADRGAGLFNDKGIVTINTSTISANNATGDGAGLYNELGTLTIDSSTISGNFSANNAGGIMAHAGAVTIINSTISDNHAEIMGGGIYSDNSLTITNSTFSANIAKQSGAGVYSTSKLVVTNSTFSGNEVDKTGGVIHNDGGEVTLANTIVANPTSGWNCLGTITDGGGNLSWGDSTCPGINADPKLSTLGSYGGFTQTFALLPGSAAIDAGDDAVCAADPVNNLDQRGVHRPLGSQCDIGAFESGGFTLSVSGGSGQNTAINTAFANPLQVGITPIATGEPVNGGTVIFTAPGSGASAVLTGSPAAISGGYAQVTATANSNPGSYSVGAKTPGATGTVGFSLTNCSFAITVTNSNDSGAGSLRQAIVDICPGGTITFAGDTTIYLVSTLTIDKNMTIDGSGHTITVSGSGNVGVFYVNSGVTFNLNHLVVTNGKAGYGGGINNWGALTITNSIFSANNADNRGGGIYNNGSLTITDSTFSGNFSYIGGGIDSSAGTLEVKNSTFSGNSATFGGGIYNYATLTITNSTFSANSASTRGGGLYFDATTAEVTNSTFSANSASVSAGGIFKNFGTFTLRNTTVANSTSGGNCLGTITDGGGNLVWGDSTCPGINADPRLSTLGSYGGSTQTFALLPGSAAIDAGLDAICTASPVNALDQRGVHRPQGTHCDIGAFESGGFTLSISGGNNQSTAINTAFTNPLQVGITPVFTGEPVNGGTVLFTAPGSGASAVLTGSPAAISGGHAQVTATANSTPGTYSVEAGTIGATGPVGFSLTNCPLAIIVINSNDSGAGSLRQAIADVCPGGTITFAGDTTIYLASTLTIDKNMTIDGSGHTVTVSGDTGNNGSADVRVFFVNLGVTFNLNHLIVTKGYSDFGGGINNRGTLSITNSIFSANNASTHGGAIYNYYGTLAIANSTFFANSAEMEGGGIHSANNVTISNSTFSANSAGTVGGGIINSGGNFAINNSTFSGNSATHGGGIYNYSGPLVLRNTIVANSTSGGNCYGPITNGGNNIDSGTTCGWGSASGSMSSTDPKLSALGSYGGSTQTFALLPGSAAINAGNDTICTAGPVNALDQRGVHRPQGTNCDIGAFESGGFTLSVSGGNNQSTTINTAFSNPLQVGIIPVTTGEPVDGGTVIFTAPGSGASAVLTGSPAAILGGLASVNATANSNLGSYNVDASTAGAAGPVGFSLTNCSLAITVTNSNDSGAGSLRQAIADICPGGTITFAGDTTVYLASTLTIDKNMTIDGSGHTVTVSGSGNVGVFYVNSSVTFNLNHLIVTGGNSIYGGGIDNRGVLTITNSTFSANNASNGGGAIYNLGTLTITSSTFSANNTGGSGVGGGLFNSNGTVAISNSTFLANNASAGGGIYNNDTLTISNSTFSANYASFSVGGILNGAGSLTITNSTISGNTSPRVGGIYNQSLNPVMLYNTIVANSTPGENCYGPITDGGGNLAWGDSTCPVVNADPKLSVLGSYGGTTQTFALLPGSAAIDAGLDAICTASPVNALDQRGIPRPRGLHCDIGAFESRGFTLSISGGNNQSTTINTAFANPLQVSVSSASHEPVEGGMVVFTPPDSGASAVISGSPAAISGGNAQVTATANENVGLYNVNAITSGASAGVDFALQNTCGASSITVGNSNDSGTGSLRQAMTDLCPGGTITFAGDNTIYLASTLTIDKNMTIDGASHTVTISGDTGGDGSGNVRVFYVNSSLTFNLKNLAVTKGYVSSGGGSGIFNNGTLTITNSIFYANNTGGPGGGILNNEGAVAISNSTFSGNSAHDGGGIINIGFGTITITNSTFSENSATSGGAIDNYGSLTLLNTIVANSTSGGNCYGTITDGGGNLVWGDSTCPGINADPILSALGSYGGITQTFALLPGSAAIDAGLDAVCLATDQRGVTRPQGGKCDIGAFESHGFTLSISGGNYQSTLVSTAFPNPLIVAITALSAVEPVDGGQVLFKASGSGASAVLTGNPATIYGGLASVTATANGIGGAYQVEAYASGANDVFFNLANILYKIFLPLVKR